MKINEIIREKRKALSLTQEQIADFLGVSTPAVSKWEADFLGVSTPAVSKWEKGAAYPDITLLPALARLLKTDLNTLLSFQEDLTDIEIENFVNDLDKTVQEQGYERLLFITYLPVSAIRKYMKPFTGVWPQVKFRRSGIPQPVC